MSHKTPLVQRMRTLADSGHIRAADLRRHADLIDEAVSGLYGNPQTVSVKTFLGVWARASRCWSECSGEPLI